MAEEVVNKYINIIRQMFIQFGEYVDLQEISESFEMLDIYFSIKSYDNIDPDIDMDPQYYYEMKSKIFKHLEILSKEILHEGIKSHIRLILPTKTVEYIYDDETNTMETKTITKENNYY